MSYDSPSDKLDYKEICEYLKLTNQLSIFELIQQIWKDGFNWGYELGSEGD